MTTAVQHRRGTTAEHSTFTGLEGEVTIDTTKDTAVIHDGSLAGGYPLAKETLANVNPSTLSAITGAATASDDLFLMYDTSALAMKKISRAELNNAITIEALDTVDINGGTIDGTTIGGTTPAAGSFTTLTTSGTVTHSGGTANGVAYLNGSKVLTTGSALTFDGSTLNITGTATMDGLTVDGVARISDAVGTLILEDNNQTAGTRAFGLSSKSGDLYIRSFDDTYATATERLSIDHATGDISFYEDTGTTPKFFWDASAESLGIGTSSPTDKLHVDGGASSTYIKVVGQSATAYFGQDTVGLTVYQKANKPIYFVTNDTERARIDSSGNLGLGVTPSAWGAMLALQLGNYGSGLATWKTNRNTYITSNAYFGSDFRYATTGAASYYNVSGEDGAHKWYTAPSGTAGNAISFTQAMTLDASGNLLVGTTSNPFGARCMISSNAIWALETQRETTSSASQVAFRNPNGIVGTISTGGSSTAYNTSSDYRLKEDWQPMTGASERVKALKPVNFAWKADGSRVDGFLAHEAQAVVPEAVTGEKDAVDADGNPVYQGIDQSKLVPLLTAALQEALAEIDSLKSRLTDAGL